MKRLIPMLASVALATAGFSGEPPRLLDKANVLPLALDDAFQFRKTKTFLNDPLLQKPTIDPMIAFERQRVNFGAVTNIDRQARYGHYFTFSCGRSARRTSRCASNTGKPISVRTCRRRNCTIKVPRARSARTSK